MARLLLQLSEFDITVVNPKGIKSHALADLLAWFPSGEHEQLYEDVRAEISLVKESEWRLAFDGSTTHQGGEARGEGRSCIAKRQWHRRFSIV